MDIAKEIAQLAQIACIWEACAPKPGNVNRRHDFSGTTLEDFLLSAVAIGDAFRSAAHMSIGQIIRTAVESTRQRVRTNTNLGMILLLAPLVKACLNTANNEDLFNSDPANIRQSLRKVLKSLTVEEARDAYAAIRLARPGGMGRVPESDIAGEPSIALLQAMALAQERDAVAREYVTDYAITFEIGLPAMDIALSQGALLSGAIVQTFLTVLSRVPDTLIARKRGWETARQISERAGDVLNKGGIFTPEGQKALESMDQALRDESHSLNPGTTADLTTAVIFLSTIKKGNSEDGGWNVPDKCDHSW